MSWNILTRGLTNLSLTTRRFYAKPLRRTPIRVIKNGDVLYDKTNRKPPPLNLERTNLLPDDICMGRSFIKTDAGDMRLGRLVTSAKSLKLRKESGVVLLEGSRLITDAILSGAQVTGVYFDNQDNLRDVPLDKTSCDIFKVTSKEMKKWSDVVTPPGIMALCRMPAQGDVPCSYNQEQRLPVSLVCDNIRDPGNMGTLIRSAAAASCHRVITTPGCVDVWDPKVIRSAMGAHFHISILPSVPWYLLPNYFSPDTAIYLAECSQTDEAEGSLFDVTFEGGETVVVIGGETHGVSVEARKMSQLLSHSCQPLSIPMMSQIDSLNAGVAASIILFEIKKQLSSK